jgi:hypothetical protein
MTTEIYNKIKSAANQTNDDSILGATVRRILQEARALEAMKSYDEKQTNMFEDTKTEPKVEDMLGGNLADVHMRERFQK